MLRIISFLFLLIISRLCYSETIPAVSVEKFYVGINSKTQTVSSSVSEACSKYLSLVGGDSIAWCDLNGIGYYKKESGGGLVRLLDSVYRLNVYSCSSGYFLSDSAGNADSSGSYCTKNSCQDLYQTSTLMEIPAGQTVTNACFGGCSASLYEGGSWSCPSSSVACAIRVQFDGNSCSGGVDYAPNASSSDSGSDSDSPPPPPPCSAGSTTGTVNGETVTTCADDGTNSPPITDTPSSSTPTTTSGAGSTVGSPENTSGTQNSTVGGGTGSLGGSGYGEGGSTGSSGGADSGSTSSGGADSGSTSGSGTDSGGTSSGGADSGSTSGSGTDSGGTSSGGADSGSTSGGGTDSGGSSGSGGGSDTGTGTPASGAGDTDSDTPAEEEEESGDGGGTFAEPGEGTDYLKDVFSSEVITSIKTEQTTVKDSIKTAQSSIKDLFDVSSVSMSGSMQEDPHSMYGATVDLSGKNVIDRFTTAGIGSVFWVLAVLIGITVILTKRS